MLEFPDRYGPDRAVYAAHWPDRGRTMTQVAARELSDGRQRLIKTAFKLFADKGFDSVTVRDIAGASDVSIGLITHHFGSKEGLRTAVDKYFIAQLEEVLKEDVPRAPKDTDAYSAWIDAWQARHQDDLRAGGRYLRRALLEESEWGAEIFKRYYAFVQSWVVKADAQGDIRPDVDRLWLPFLIIFLELGTTLLDPYIRRVLGRSRFDAQLSRRLHRAYTSLILRGIAPSREDKA
jgi:AcrR family transcriptional regulator